jgi:hypothetical protein
VDWKVCKSAIALCLSVIKRTRDQGATNPIIGIRTRYFRYAYPPKRDILVSEVGDLDRIGFINSGWRWTAVLPQAKVTTLLFSNAFFFVENMKLIGWLHEATNHYAGQPSASTA